MKNKSGFTLLEIMMVMTIVGIIGAVFSAQMTTTTKSWEAVEDNISVQQELTDAAKFIGAKMKELDELSSVGSNSIQWVRENGDPYHIYLDTASANVVYKTSANKVVLCEDVVSFSVSMRTRPLALGSAMGYSVTTKAAQVLDFYISKDDKQGKSIGINALHFLRDSIRGEFGVDTTLYYEYFNVSDNITSGLYQDLWSPSINQTMSSYVRLKWPRQTVIDGKYTVASLNFSLEAESTTLNHHWETTMNIMATGECYLGSCSDSSHYRYHYKPGTGWEPCSGFYYPQCPDWYSSWHATVSNWHSRRDLYRRFYGGSVTTYNILITETFSVTANMAFQGDLHLEVDSMQRTDSNVSGNDLIDGDETVTDLYNVSMISTNIGYAEISVEYIPADDFFIFEFWAGASGLGKESTQNLKFVFDKRETSLSFIKY